MFAFVKSILYYAWEKQCFILQQFFEMNNKKEDSKRNPLFVVKSSRIIHINSIKNGKGNNE
jgi:hypothetical protein